jgi:hypothetical protein
MAGTAEAPAVSEVPLIRAVLARALLARGEARVAAGRPGAPGAQASPSASAAAWAQTREAP